MDLYRHPGHPPGHLRDACRAGATADPDALVNTAAGASWISVHHGGGVGIGYSLHAGMVVVADGSARAERKLERVLTTDTGTAAVLTLLRSEISPPGPDRFVAPQLAAAEHLVRSGQLTGPR